jgi:hypothetical protein
MERLFESIEFYIDSSTGYLQLRVIYIDKNTNRVEKNIPVMPADVNDTNAVINLANKLLDKAGM